MTNTLSKSRYIFHWQNFESIPHIPDTEVSYYGGSVALADYCPYIQEFTWRSNNVVVRGSHCMYGENNPSKYLILDSRGIIRKVYNVTR